ncbi:uncharacterized protein LOC127602759 [Hippocampus zosterae]|uniref:uncharacterized protein LOC127602759 n=1 Tax=Hippocampus zosterae TaxID=109293 RepID=UPI00223E1248|nr:uncharacterized protein LOC127602759 [Hippocampus zosterae]
MAPALKRLLLHSALLVTLVALRCRPALLAAISCPYAFSRLKLITLTLSLETEHLLDEYMAFQGLSGVPSNVPDYTVRGSNFSEQLQDIYARNVLFKLHIKKVTEYQIEDWGNPINVAEPLNQVAYSLFSQTNMLVLLTQRLYPEVALTTVEPPHLSHNHSWPKKSYGWNVIVGLKYWLAEVNKVLQAAQELCDNHVDEAPGGSRTLGGQAPKSNSRRKLYQSR